MRYNLKTSSNETLLRALDILIMYKAEYSDFLDKLQSGDITIGTRGFFHVKMWYEDGVTLNDFDEEIIAIQNELDSDRRYE